MGVARIIGVILDRMFNRRQDGRRLVRDEQRPHLRGLDNSSRQGAERSGNRDAERKRLNQQSRIARVIARDVIR